MSEASSQQHPELAQHRLRVTAIDRKLDAALADLTDPDQRENQDLPGFLYFYSGKMFTPRFTTHEQQEAFDKYRTRLRLATDPRDTYETEPGISVLDNKGQIEGIGLRIRLGTTAALEVIAPPFYDSKFNVSKLLPVRYRIPYPALDIQDRLEAVRKVIAEGATLDELVLVDQKTFRKPVLLRPTPSRIALGELGIEAPMGKVIPLDRRPSSGTPPSLHAS